jgi:flagellar hook-associated protein 1 FlgK
MGLTNGALQIGQSALLSYQSALQAVGNNIANSSTDGFVRRTPQLTPMPGVPLPEGLMPGGGVALTALQRSLDEALEARLRAAIGDEQKSLTEQQILSQVESLYNELGDHNLSSLLSAFFNAFEDVQNQPTDIPTRTVAIAAGQSLAKQLQQTRSSLLEMNDHLNQQIVDATRQANDLIRQIADLNLQIVAAESAGKGAAASLRDQRDGALKQLAQLMDIQSAETPEGAVNVYVGNLPLVQYARYRSLTTVEELDGDRMVVAVRFADDNGPVTIASGQIAGLVNARDQQICGQIQQLDQLAAALIEQVNRLHSQGQGLEGLTDLTGAYGVLDPSAALNAAGSGLSFAPANGAFKLTVDAGTDQSQEYVIPISLTGLGADTSLNDLVDYINANVANVTASVTSENHLRLQAAAGHSFAFGADSSGALAGLGMNVFFTGRDAADIGVESELAAHPQWLAAARENRPGDGSNAAAISALNDTGVPGLNGLSIPQQWRSVVGQLATASGQARHDTETTHSVSQSLESQRASISGVNTDEEAVNLMQYQRSFQAAARYISIVDQLVSEMLSLVR